MSKKPTFFTTDRRGRLILFGFLYFVQGTLIAYVLVFNNLYLRTHGGAAWQLGVLNGALVIPFILKILIGIISDRTSLFGLGHRVPYIALGSIMILIGTLLILTVDPIDQFALFTLLAVLMALGLAFYDTTVDGLAVDLTPAEDYGVVQGSMVVGRSMGLVALASLYGRLIESVGWSIVFILLAIFSLTPFLFLWTVREPKERPESQKFETAALKTLWKPSIRRLSTYALIYSFVVYGANGLVSVFLAENLGQTIVQVGDAAAVGGAGMLLGGALATLVARWTKIWVQGNVTAALVSIGLLLLAMFIKPENIWLIIFLWGVCLAASEFIYVTLAMMYAEPRLGAASYAIFMAISNAGIGVGQSLTNSLIDTIDEPVIFVSLAILNLAIFPILARMRHDADADPALAQPSVASGS